uniref:ribose-5-phosphate isomerase n=1 Tax=Sexangularia sp. CB-2014 TaxID=1486929 RepID=A0A7S1VGR4_9EUKA
MTPKEQVATYVASLLTPPPASLGVGSGSTVALFMHALAVHLRTNGTTVDCLPSSSQSTSLIDACHCTRLTQWADAAKVGLHLVVDGADRVRVTPDGRVALIKGGGACLLQEKLVVQHATLRPDGSFWAMVEESKFVDGPLLSCGFPVPVEVTKESVHLLHALLAKSDRVVSATTRVGSGKCGPLLTDNAMYIVDVVFTERYASAVEADVGGFAAADAWLRSLVPGVAATGIFHDESAPTDVFWINSAGEPQRRTFGSSKRKRT